MKTHGNASFDAFIISLNRSFYYRIEENEVDMDYKVFDLSVARDQADLVCASLYDFPIQGVEIVDPFITKEEMKAMFVDDMAIENVPNNEVIVRFYLSYEDDIESIFQEIMKNLLAMKETVYLGSLDVTREESKDEDWAHNWKKFYKPFMIGDRILVRPIWEDTKSIGDIKPEIIIDIDPGMAFGSGTHETTYMCVTALDKYLSGGEVLVDVGCGSGILGIAGAKLGIQRGILIDLDQSACAIAKENVENNQVKDQLRVIHGNLVDYIREEVDVVVANIFAEIIIGVTPDVSEIVKHEGLFIASGIIREKEELVVQTLKDNGFLILEILRKGGWVAIASKKVS